MFPPMVNSQVPFFFYLGKITPAGERLSISPVILTDYLAFTIINIYLKIITYHYLQVFVFQDNSIILFTDFEGDILIALFSFDSPGISSVTIDGGKNIYNCRGNKLYFSPLFSKIYYNLPILFIIIPYFAKHSLSPLILVIFYLYMIPFSCSLDV